MPSLQRTAAKAELKDESPGSAASKCEASFWKCLH
jgi:hypothetical protein